MFLFGINFMSQGLEQALGGNLRGILERTTSRSALAVITGAVVTALIQSSGATMVMVVGFIQAQLMQLAQGLFIMLGASVGTTVTAQIIAFDIDPWAPLILFVGMVLYLFIKKRAVKKVGAVVLGFGTLFMGIYLMGEAIERMELGGLVFAFLNNFRNPLLSLLFGFLFTFVLQSSSAAVGILQVMAGSALASTMTQPLELSSVVFMVMGMNVGAVAPAIISSLGGNRASRRAAYAELAVKLLSVAVFSAIILVFPRLLLLIESLSPTDLSRQIANLHLGFNVVTAVLLFPFIRPIAKVFTNLLPDDPDEQLLSKKLLYVSNDMTKGPAAIISLTKQEVLRFADICSDNFERAVSAFLEHNESLADQVYDVEVVIDYLDRELGAYILGLQTRSLSDSDAADVITLSGAVKDLERIGDHAENIAGYTRLMLQEKTVISDIAMQGLSQLGEMTVRNVRMAVEAFRTGSVELQQKVEVLEEEIDQLSAKLVNDHIERLKFVACDPRGGVVYTEIISDLERISDHCTNLAETVPGAVIPEKERGRVDKII